MKKLKGVKYNLIVFAISALIANINAQSVHPLMSKEYQPANPYKVDSKGPRDIPGMSLVWDDEFNTDGKPSADNWAYEYGFVRNRELQWYQPQNAYCKGGKLIIEGKKERIENPNYNPTSDDWRTNNSHAEYSSTCLITKGLHEWLSYGYFEIRARFDTVNGAWPAIWLLGTEGYWPFCGEIDMMEFYRINEVPTILANVAWGSETEYHGSWDSEKKPLSKFLEKDPEWAHKFHIWSMIWKKETIQLLIDGELINEIPLTETVNPDGSNPFSENKKHYMLINLALGSNGGDPANSPLPIKFEIDYVRVYKAD